MTCTIVSELRLYMTSCSERPIKFNFKFKIFICGSKYFSQSIARTILIIVNEDPILKVTTLHLTSIKHFPIINITISLLYKESFSRCSNLSPAQSRNGDILCSSETFWRYACVPFQNNEVLCKKKKVSAHEGR